MSNWFEREYDKLQEEMAEGGMTPEQAKRALRQLRAELREEAENAASAAYDGVMNDHT